MKYAFVGWLGLSGIVLIFMLIGWVRTESAYDAKWENIFEDVIEGTYKVWLLASITMLIALIVWLLV